MLHISDVIKEKSIRILQNYCNGGYGGPRLAQAQIEQIANALAIELLPGILAAVQGAISEAAMLTSRPIIVPKE